MYKMIAIDLDGTLLDEEKVISDRARKCIARLKEDGKRVVLATGRPLRGIVPYIDQLDLLDEKDYVVAYNGANVQGTTSKNVLLNKPLSLDAYKELYTVSKQLGVHIHALTKDSVLTPKNNPYTEIESTINQIPTIEGALDDVDASTNIIKVMFVDDPKKLDDILPLIPNWIKEKYEMLRSAPIFLEFLDKDVNKGVGISLIAQHLGIKQEEIIAVGDADNDIAMIKYAGLGVAMGNATDDVKEIADYITLTNEEDGVAHLIEKFMF